MPKRTGMLDSGNFVRSPEAPADAEFVAYLDQIDRLLGQWQRTGAGEAERELYEFIEPFKQRYTIRSVTRDTAFLPVSQFLARYRPIEKPFAIVHCALDMPLHSVHRFRDHDDLAVINAAVAEDSPLRWWQNGLGDRPCYLFGKWVWELKPAEAAASEEGIALLFLQMSEKGQQELGQTAAVLSSRAKTDPREFIPEKVRSFVWRRDGGKCAKCGGHQGLEFYHVVPPNAGGSGAGNIQLLCGQCSLQREQRAGSVAF
jgi:hypothetical protein